MADVTLTFDGVLGGTIKADLTAVKAELNALTNKEYVVKMKLDQGVLSKQIKGIQGSVTQAGKGAGILGASEKQIQQQAQKAVKARAKAIEKALKASNARNTTGLGLGFDVKRDAWRTARRELQHAGLSYEATNKMTAGLRNALMQVGKVDVGFQKAGNSAERLVKMTVQGVDQMKNMVKITRTFNPKTGAVTENTRVTQDFAKSQKAAAEAQKRRNQQLSEWNKVLKQSSKPLNAAPAGEYQGLSRLGAVRSAEDRLLQNPLSDPAKQQAALGYVRSLRAEMEKFSKSNTAMTSNMEARYQNVMKTIKGFRDAEKAAKKETDTLTAAQKKATTGFDNKYAGLTGDIGWLSGNQYADPRQLEELTNRMTKLKEARDALQRSGRTDEASVAEMQNLHRSLKDVEQDYKNIRKAANQAERDQKRASGEMVASASKVQSVYQKYEEFLTKNSRLAASPYGDQVKTALAELGSNRQFSVKELGQYEARLKNIQVMAREAGVLGQTMGDRIVGAFQKFGGWMMVTHSITKVISGIKQMVSNVRDLDAAMTELKKVTDGTDIEYERFFQQASKRAKETGATLTDTIQASSDFARLGYSMDEAANLADTAIVYKNVGDGLNDINDASQSVISTMKAFGIEAGDAMSIVDRFNEVGNKYAISSAGVGEALTRSASALAAGNNTLDESIALITAGNEVVNLCHMHIVICA